MQQHRRPAGELESSILAALWAASEPLTPAQVLAALDEDLAYTTVMTTLARLHDKGAVCRERTGRAYAYTPAADAADTVAEKMRRLLDRGDHATVLARFVNTLDDADGRVLSELLRVPRRRRPT
ncbi:MAG: BlaI/MecI/CopY family transcriptional regulator [Acidothermaceae bacterium]